MGVEAVGGDGVEAAARRLDQALSRLAVRIGGIDPHATAAALSERNRLAAQLDVARNRERLLEAMAGEASAALGRAADEVRAALQAEGEPAGSGLTGSGLTGTGLAGDGLAGDGAIDDDEAVLVLTDPAPDPTRGGAR